MKPLLCLFGYHRDTKIGLMQFGRGKLVRCERCGLVRAFPVSDDELDADLKAQVESVKKRASDRVKSVEIPAEIIFETWFDEETPPAPDPEPKSEAQPDAKSACRWCKRPVTTSIHTRCPRCGTKR